MLLIMIWTLAISLLLGAYAVNLSPDPQLSVQASSCTEKLLENNICDPQCNSKEFDFDNGNCKSDNDKDNSRKDKDDSSKDKDDSGKGNAKDQDDLGQDDGKCAKPCSEDLQGNDICESWCNLKAFNFDDGDCDGCNDRNSGLPCVRFCEPAYLGDGYCDELCNFKVLGFDGGDCIVKCNSNTIGDKHCNPECDNEDNEFDGGDCVVCETGYKNVAGICILNCNEVAGNGVCNEDCNTEEFHFDGGDCIQCDPGYKLVDHNCVKECDIDTIGDKVCNPECNNSSGNFDGGDCISCENGYKRIGLDCVKVITCDPGWEVVDDHCEKVCIQNTIGNGLCNIECYNADNSLDGGDCTKCEVGLVNKDNDCVDFCKTQAIPTGKCDKNCVDSTNWTCNSCANGYKLQDGFCIRLLWVSEPFEPVGDGPVEHKTVVVSGQNGWVIVPGTQWIWDTNINNVGTYKFTDNIWFDDWLKPRITTVSLTVSVDDYYRILVNGKVVVEKAGVWNQAPISYDITSLIQIDATPLNPNILEIHATNTGGPGGLSYKVVAHQQCPAGADEVNGNCACRRGTMLSGECLQTIWVSTPKTIVGEGAGAYPAVEVVPWSGLQSVSGATWIWDTNSSKVGTFTFIDNIWLSDWVKSRLASVTITLSVDDYYKLIFNGQTVSEKSGVWNAAPISFDLTSFFNPDATSSNPNVLKIVATNTGGPGGLQYKLVVNLKCDEGLKPYNGNCVCVNGNTLINGSCAGTQWVSGSKTVASGEYPATLVQPQTGWQAIPGAMWVWDSDINKVGTFRFSQDIAIPDSLKSKIVSAAIVLSVDDYYKLVFNGDTITEKSGVWSGSPITFDLTSHFDPAITNKLEIYATNSGGPAGLEYKLSLKQQCQDDATNVNGVCTCKAGFAQNGDNCIKTTWVSSVKTKASISTRPAVAVDANVNWKPVTDARWIWDMSISKVGVITFPIDVPLTNWHKNNILKATLEISVDDFYRINFNGKDITPKAGAYDQFPITYDLTKFLQFPEDGSSIKTNPLFIQPTNTGGPGGLDFKLKLHLKCKSGETDVNSVCVCKVGFLDLNGECIQTRWTPGNPDGQVGDGEIEHKSVLIKGYSSWHLVPGAEWVWDTVVSKVGTYKFYEDIVFDDWLKPKIVSVSLMLSVDDFYRIVVNGHTVVEKAGIWNQAPISYDLTPYINIDATADQPNSLEIHATNTGGPGGLSYKLIAHQKCPAGMEEVNGNCVCILGMIVDGKCLKTVWVSTPKTLVGEGAGASPAVEVGEQDGWQSIPGATWIWDSSTNKIGTFTFVDNIYLADSLISRVVSASITLSVDDYYKLIFNGKTISEKSGVRNGAPITFDLTSNFNVDATSAKPNVLKILADNYLGPGGLQYKLVVTLTCDENQISVDGKCVCVSGTSLVNGQCVLGTPLCQENSSAVDGACICKDGFADAGGLCIQTTWVSGRNTKADISLRPWVSVVPNAGWRPVDGRWIWDTSISKVGVITFPIWIDVTDWHRDNIERVGVAVSCDDFYRIKFNGVEIVAKGGVWNGAPIEYDLTQYVQYPNGGDSPLVNLLQIQTTNTGGPGGLDYKVTFYKKCKPGATDVDGTCMCKTVNTEWEGNCIQTSWVSQEGVLVGDGEIEHKNVLVPAYSSWQLVPGSAWIWDTITSKVGTYKFTDTIVFDDFLKTRISTVSLAVSADDYYRIVVNGQVVVEKAGVWNAAPLSYDITTYLDIQATADKPNVLDIHATNIVGPGGLSYKVVAHQTCAADSTDVEGECVCKVGTRINGECTQNVWYSSPKATIVGEGAGAYAAVTVAAYGSWQAIPGATWVWDTITTKVGAITFIDKIWVTDWLKTRVGNVSITLSADDYYKLVFNGVTITEKAGVWNGAPVTFDITSYFRADATAANPNVLKIIVTNTVGLGGLQYKLVVSQLCTNGLKNADINCLCGSGTTEVSGECIPSVWVSGANTFVANTYPATVEVGNASWQPIPGAAWIWDTNISKVGTFTFTETINVPVTLQSKVAGASITLSVDDYYKLVFNGVTITEKAGVWNGPPVTFDLTPNFHVDTPNTLEIYATNIVGPGGLQYKVRVKRLCQAGAADIDGTCKCASGFADAGDRCVQTAWVSRVNTVADISTRPAVLIVPETSWQPVPDAKWIWDVAKTKVAVVTFLDSFLLPEVQSHYLSKATLTVSCDDFYRIVFNGVEIVAKGGIWNGAPISYDVSALVRRQVGASNDLKIQATNIGGPGGLAYKFQVKITKCRGGAVEPAGVCRCKDNYSILDDYCHQSVWVSTPTSLSANIAALSSQLQTRTVKTVTVDGAWHSIPGATWVWDTTTLQGSYAFVEYILIPAVLKDHITGAKVTVSVDEHYKLIWNDQVIVQQGGEYFIDPISYDVTPYLVYDDVQKNVLRFDAVNLSGPGGIAYKVELTIQKCKINQNELSGVCVDRKVCNYGMIDLTGTCLCKSGFTPLGSACYQPVWVSTPNSLSANVTPLDADLKTRKVIVPPIASGWQFIPGATWVWDSTAAQGTFAFVEYISIPTGLRDHIGGAKLTATVDENYKLIFNNQVITPNAGTYFSAPLSYDVTQYLIYDDANPNILRFDVTNLSGPGGLSYKFELTINKCKYNQNELNGVCVDKKICNYGMVDLTGNCECKTGFVPNGSACYQTLWVSSARSLSANLATPSTSLQTRKVTTPSLAGGWQSIPGSTWVWDSTAAQGTFAFVEYVSIPAALLNHIATAKVTVGVDENYKLLLNDQVVVPSAGNWAGAPLTYDVKHYLNYDDANPNILRFDVTNLSGPGGLTYKFEITLN